MSTLDEMLESAKQTSEKLNHLEKLAQRRERLENRRAAAIAGANMFVPGNINLGSFTDFAEMALSWIEKQEEN